ncbi:unnamed protein product [Sphenostylis stenocarpa]|uniref:GH18 domain-containing protein n=1 Tax=Sphenostylis stenocarpa TaxID=92480 RepID=A0AA86W4L6_9FABA|nr:unnamed protein product [Sphenostylis stenocarpa]
MGCRRVAFVLFLFSLLTLSCSQVENGVIGVYWGQDHRDGDLQSTCDSGNYRIVLLAFLRVFGEGRRPHWDFVGLCDSPFSYNCTELEPQIKHCQAKGIKVFLSIGGPPWSDYSLSSAEDAKNVARYIYRNFLSGRFGPLGSVELDGVEFHIRKSGNHWDDLVKELDFFRHSRGPYFQLAAAPRCPVPVYYLGNAIETKLFDYIFVRFYEDPCCEASYEGDTTLLLESWDKWVNLAPPNSTIFLGLLSSLTAGGTGYVRPSIVNREVLPHVKKASNYGGVILWNRYRDIVWNFSGRILPNVPKSTLLSSVS